MPARNRRDPKRDALNSRHALHRRAQEVSDPLFQDSEFFDPCDLVQVKYEMLRRARVDGLAVSHAARAFGLSRPSFYEAKSDFARAGLVGLLPQKRGPRRGHKLSEPVMRFIIEQLAADPSVDSAALADMILARFKLTVHPRSIERAREREKKARPGPRAP